MFNLEAINKFVNTLGDLDKAYDRCCDICDHCTGQKETCSKDCSECVVKYIAEEIEKRGIIIPF